MMIDDVTAARDAAVERIAAAPDAAAARALGTELLGKKGPFAGFKVLLGSLATVDDKRTAGQAVNAAVADVSAALDGRLAALAGAERAAQLEAEALDLTEVLVRPRRGHAHVVTQASERLEDVFIGLGFQIAEGPEVESDWYNFEALNMGPGHPARGMWDTLFTDHVPPGGQPGTVVLRTHTSPVQIRVMETTEPPIYMVMPGRVFRRDTPDATHMPVFHQIEGLVIDRGITMAATTAGGVCLRLRRPVKGIDPLGIIRHAGVTLGVDRPDEFVRVVEQRRAVARRSAGDVPPEHRRGRWIPKRRPAHQRQRHQNHDQQMRKRHEAHQDTLWRKPIHRAARALCVQ